MQSSTRRFTLGVIPSSADDADAAVAAATTTTAAVNLSTATTNSK